MFIGNPVQFNLIFLQMSGSSFFHFWLKHLSSVWSVGIGTQQVILTKQMSSFKKCDNLCGLDKGSQVSDDDDDNDDDLGEVGRGG